ncbi:MAG: hypothetical protein NVS2B9_04680 [Myxococcales bacterium]
MAAISGARPHTAPASRSLWPPWYLVQEWMTRSAPIASGRWFTGVAKVESIIKFAPGQLSRPAAATTCWPERCAAAPR